MSGTVNVEVNEPMRAALARIKSQEPLHLRVGFDEVELTTIGAATTERRVRCLNDGRGDSPRSG